MCTPQNLKLFFLKTFRKSINCLVIPLSVFAARATDRGMTVSTQSQRATQIVLPQVWTQQLETAETQRLNARVSEAAAAAAADAGCLNSKLHRAATCCLFL